MRCYFPVLGCDVYYRQRRRCGRRCRVLLRLGGHRKCGVCSGVSDGRVASRSLRCAGPASGDFGVLRGIKDGVSFVDPLTVLTSSSLLLAAVTYAWPFANNMATFAVVAVLAGCVAIFAPDQCFFGLTLTSVSQFPWQNVSLGFGADFSWEASTQPLSHLSRTWGAWQMSACGSGWDIPS